MEFLKPILGDELYAQVEAALKGNDKVKLANLADGQYVGRDKFEALEKIKNGFETENGNLKKLDAAGLQATNEKLTTDNAALKLGRKLDAALYGAEAKNVVAVGAMLDMSKISLDDAGNLVGADEQIKALKQSQAWAFGQPGVPGAGGNPAVVVGGEQKTTFSDAIQARLDAQSVQE